MPRNKLYNPGDVLKKAMIVFWENGYEATTVRQLEKEMGINQFSIYSTFSDKKNLFIESLKQYKSFVKDTAFKELLIDGADISFIEHFLLKYSEKIKEQKSSRGCLMVNTVAEIGSKDNTIHAEAKQYFEFVRRMFKDILIRSKEKGEISSEADIEKCSSYLVGIMQGLSIASKVMSQQQLSDFIITTITSIKKF